jgi:hypothetical protein
MASKEMLHDELNDEQLIPDEDLNNTEVPKESIPANAFRERLNEDPANNFYEEDFAASIDSAENPHLSDQLDDEELRKEAEADYR